MKTRLTTGGLLVLCLASCQEGFIVKVERGDPVRFTFQEDNILYHEQFTPCLKFLQVFEISEASMPVKTWEVRAAGRDCVGLKAVDYGVVPEGFSQQGASVPLTPGPEYRVEAADDSARGGAGQFRLTRS